MFENFHIYDVFHYRSWGRGGGDRIQIPLDKSCVSPSNVSKHCRAQMSQAFYNKNISIRDTRQLFPKRNEKYFIPGWTWTVSMLANFAPRFQQFSKLFHERFVTILIIVRYDMFHAYKNFDEKVEKIETMLSRGRTSSNNLKSSSENP